MSHHHDEEIDVVATQTGDNTTSRHHLHSHLHLKPTVVFDHIKTKVKRKKSSNNGLPEIPNFATHNNINGNNIPKRTNQEQNELEFTRKYTESRSPNVIITRRLSEPNSDRIFENTNNELDLTDGKDENNAIVPDHIDKDEVISELVQWRVNPFEHDTDNDQKNTKLKGKSNKVSKSPPESTNNKSNTKNRRQTIRHSIQSSAKIQPNDKNKRNDSYNTQSLTGFQIRDEDFNTIFSDLPSDEQLVVAYPCVWRKDIFMHGRIFLSVNYLCFYTCFFKWEESLCIAYKDIINVTKEKSGKIIPNAIQLETRNGEQYLFASYTPRERIYIALIRLWQNISLEKPLDYQQLRTIISADQMSIDESTGDSEEYVVLENNGENSLDHHVPSQVIPSITSNHLRESSSAPTQPTEKPVSTLPPDSNKEQTIYVSSCPCETHLARTYADRLFTYHVDQLFELIYGNNSFTRAYHDSQKLTDYTIGEWYINNETEKRERLVTYKTVTQSIFGTNTLTCNEKQIIEVEKPRSIYVVNTEVFNEGMKYTDTFFVTTRTCMFQRDAKYSSLRTTAEVRYVKSVNGIAKSFIEKNCHSSIEDGINNLIRRLENHQTNVDDRKSKRKHTSGSKHTQKNKDDGTNQDVSISNNPILSNNQIGIKEKTTTEKGYFFNTILFIGIFLLFLHIYLCYKLYHIDQAIHSPDQVCLNECKNVCSSGKNYP